MPRSNAGIVNKSLVKNSHRSNKNLTKLLNRVYLIMETIFIKE